MDPADPGTFSQRRAVGFHHLSLHRGTVVKTNLDLARALPAALNHSVFNDVGELLVDRHSYSPKSLPLKIATMDRVSPQRPRTRGAVARLWVSASCLQKLRSTGEDHQERMRPVVGNTRGQRSAAGYSSPAGTNRFCMIGAK